MEAMHRAGGSPVLVFSSGDEIQLMRVQCLHASPDTIHFLSAMDLRLGKCGNTLDIVILVVHGQRYLFATWHQFNLFSSDRVPYKRHWVLHPLQQRLERLLAR